jgi:hypothetical protein
MVYFMEKEPRKGMDIAKNCDFLLNIKYRMALTEAVKSGLSYSGDLK